MVCAAERMESTAWMNEGADSMVGTTEGREGSEANAWRAVTAGDRVCGAERMESTARVTEGAEWPGLQRAQEEAKPTPGEQEPRVRPGTKGHGHRLEMEGKLASCSAV